MPSEYQNSWLQNAFGIATALFSPDAAETPAGASSPPQSAAAKVVAFDDDDGDDDEPTPMALDQARRPKSPPKKVSFKFDKKREGTTVGHTAAEARLALVRLRTAAREAGSNLAEEVINASLDFEKYATPKVKEIEKAHEAAAALTASLASGMLTFVGGELAAEVTSEIGKKVAEAIADGIKDNVVDRIKSLGADGDLGNVVATLTQSLRDWASARKKAIGDVIIAHIDELDEMLAAGKMPKFDDWAALAPPHRGRKS